MKFPEFITYCELKGLFTVDLAGADGRMVSIQTPIDDIGLYLVIDMTDNMPTIIKGQFYKYSDRQLNFELNGKVTMDKIEKAFFPE